MQQGKTAAALKVIGPPESTTPITPTQGRTAFLRAILMKKHHGTAAALDAFDAVWRTYPPWRTTPPKPLPRLRPRGMISPCYKNWSGPSHKATPTVCIYRLSSCCWLKPNTILVITSRPVSQWHIYCKPTHHTRPHPAPSFSGLNLRKKQDIWSKRLSPSSI